MASHTPAGSASLCGRAWRSRAPNSGRSHTPPGHRAGRQRCQDREKLAAAQLLAKHNSSRAVGPMELKDVLGEIEADGAHLVHGCLLEWAVTPPLWHADAVGGASTPSSPYTPRYRAELSVGRACRWRPVVTTEACPSVCWTSWMGAPGRGCGSRAHGAASGPMLAMTASSV